LLFLTCLTLGVYVSAVVFYAEGFCVILMCLFLLLAIGCRTEVVFLALISEIIWSMSKREVTGFVDLFVKARLAFWRFHGQYEIFAIGRWFIVLMRMSVMAPPRARGKSLLW
jgi:hypothetical protein